jgi:hypothetical protein
VNAVRRHLMRALRRIHHMPGDGCLGSSLRERALAASVGGEDVAGAGLRIHDWANAGDAMTVSTAKVVKNVFTLFLL